MEKPSAKKSMPVQLMIKSPNHLDDLKVDCDLSWSVASLKDHLSDVYPTKPLRSQQKIIYAGRLLPDNLLLNEVLTQDRSVYTMHLVCPHPTMPNKNNTSQTAANVTEKLCSTPAVPYENVVHPTPVYPEGLRQRLIGQPQVDMPGASAVIDPNSAALQMNNFAAASPYMAAYQLALMQQTYAHAMAQHFAQSGSGASTYPSHVYGSSPAAPAPTPAAQNETPEANQGQNQDVPNVAPRIDANDRENDFDFLDLTYVLTRAFMLLMVLYFYSSLGRILLVLLLALGLVIYRVAITSRNRRSQASSPAARTPEPEQTDARANPQAGAQDNQEEQNDQPMTPAAQEPPSPSVAPPSGLAVIVTFIKTFFTSLVPEPNPLAVQ